MLQKNSSQRLQLSLNGLSLTAPQPLIERLNRMPAAINKWAHWGYIACALLGLSSLGCEPNSAASKLSAEAPQRAPAVEAPAAPEAAPSAPTQPTPTLVAAGVKPWISQAQLPWDAWYLQYMEGKRIGYSYVRVSQSPAHQSGQVILIERQDCIEVVNNGTPILFRRSVRATEDSTGKLLSLEDDSRSLDNLAQTRGQLFNNTFTASTKVGDQTTSNSLTWEQGAWGLMGLQAILMQQPPQPGEILQAKVFIPQLYKIARAELVAGQPEVSALPGGKTESLIPVDVNLQTEDSGMQSRNWINDQGVVLKTVSRTGPQLHTFWTSPEMAEPVRDEYELGELLSRRVALAGGVDLASATSVTYSLQRQSDAAGQEVYQLLAKSVEQQVKSLDALTAEIVLHRASNSASGRSAETDGATGAEAKPPASTLAASAWIPSDHPRIQALALELRGGSAAAPAAEAASATLEIALPMAKGLSTRWTAAPLDRSILNPQQSVESLRGDSVDQSLLLVAMLRSQQVAARVAGGLVISPQNREQMQFDLWTEVWSDGRWVPLDTTTGQLAGVDRLKFFDSPVDSSNPYSLLLGTFRELPGLQVKLLAHE